MPTLATITHSGELDLHSRESARISRDYRVSGAALTNPIDQHPVSEYFERSGRQRYTVKGTLGLSYMTPHDGDDEGDEVFVDRLSTSLEPDTTRSARDAGWFNERTLVFDIRGRD